MIRPVRLQLSRVKGFDLQAASRAANGLAAINCARPGPWGNRFVVGRDGSASECVDLYRADLAKPQMQFYRRALAALPGHNLACYCALDAPCHVDVLLDTFGRIECQKTG